MATFWQILSENEDSNLEIPGYHSIEMNGWVSTTYFFWLLDLGGIQNKDRGQAKIMGGAVDTGIYFMNQISSEFVL